MRGIVFPMIIDSHSMVSSVDKERLRRICIGSGFDRIAVVDPKEVGARTSYRLVIVLALITPDESAEFTFKAEIGGRLRWGKWIYESLENRARKVVEVLRDMGIDCEPLEFRRSWEIIDLRRAAVRGGLGVMGENNLVVSKDWGPRLRFTAVFADLEMETDHPLNIEICNMCAICVRECTTGALDGALFDRSRCIAEFDPDDEMERLKGQMLGEVTKLVKAQCAACVYSCPYGMFSGVRGLPGL